MPFGTEALLQCRGSVVVEGASAQSMDRRTETAPDWPGAIRETDGRMHRAHWLSYLNEICGERDRMSVLE